MKVSELAEVLYEETPVEICVDFEPVFTGQAIDAKTSKYAFRNVKEVYISLSGTTLVVSVDNIRTSYKK